MMSDKMLPEIWVEKNIHGYYDGWEKQPDNIKLTSYTRTDIHEAEVKRLREALELARESLDDCFHAIMRSGPFIRAHPDIIPVHKLALDKSANTLAAIDAALGE